jgi:large subunit ribosomal protein L22
MEARCVARFLRVAPRKMRLLANLVRGKNVNQAINILQFMPKSGAQPTLKAIKSAAANLMNRDEARSVNPDELFVKTIFVDEGPTLKRFLPRAMGRATPIRKRMSHLTVLVALPETLEAEASAAPEVTAVVEEPKVVKTKKTKTVKKAAEAAPKAVKTEKTPKRSAKKKAE